MTLRVAYDISMLTRYYYRPNFEKFGIFRVAEEVLRQLLPRQDLDLTVLRLCEDLKRADPLYEALRYDYYLEDNQDWLTCQAAQVFESHLGLSKLYRSVYRTCFEPAFQQSGGKSPAALLIRILRKLLFSIHRFDIYQDFPAANFDLFHSTYLPLPARQLTQQIPRVITIYDLIPVLAPQFVTPEIHQSSIAILNSIDLQRDWAICISEHTKQDFCQYLPICPDRVFVAPLAAANYFRPEADPQAIAQVRQRYGIPDQYFLSLSSLQPRKNFVHLLRTFEQWLTEHPGLEVALVLVGHQAWTCEEIFATVATSSQLSRHVIFTGHIPDTEIACVYSGAIAFLFPSLYEGFGLPVLEAMQCGVPVIASNTTSLPEVVGRAGILVDPTDQDALCQAMVQLYQNPALGQQLRQQGLTRAQQFSWSRCADTVAAVYHQIVRQSQPQ